MYTRVLLYITMAHGWAYLRRLDPIYLKEGVGYSAFTALVTAEIGQTQDFVCPGNQEFQLYLVDRKSYHMCNVTNQQVLHNCTPYKFSKVFIAMPAAPCFS